VGQEQLRCMGSVVEQDGRGGLFARQVRHVRLVASIIASAYPDEIRTPYGRNGEMRHL
jgi:hypothetical protein